MARLKKSILAVGVAHLYDSTDFLPSFSQVCQSVRKTHLQYNSQIFDCWQSLLLDLHYVYILLSRQLMSCMAHVNQLNEWMDVVSYGEKCKILFKKYQIICNSREYTPGLSARFNSSDFGVETNAKMTPICQLRKKSKTDIQSCLNTVTLIPSFAFSWRIFSNKQFLWFLTIALVSC